MTEPSFKAVPRAHHFVPQCWLSGFTESGQKDGRLWVTDLKLKKQWPSSPANSGHRRDFYRISSDKADSVEAEQLFSKIEDTAGPLLKALDRELRGPRKQELDDLLYFIAIQWVRTPAFRPTILFIADSYYRSRIEQALRTRESWTELLKEAGISSSEPGADYERMHDFIRSGEYSLSAETEWYLMRGLEGVETIFACLKERLWGTTISRKGDFIASDTPVAMDGPKNNGWTKELQDRVQECRNHYVPC
jgi:Protein of unknown function (DUF4238)